MVGDRNFTDRTSLVRSASCACVDGSLIVKASMPLHLPHSNRHWTVVRLEYFGDVLDPNG
jgi:hypothetical protein